MAELDVQPKRSTPWWVWLLLLLITIILLFFFNKGCNSDSGNESGSDTTKTVATTQPDWNSVDVNAADDRRIS